MSIWRTLPIGLVVMASGCIEPLNMGTGCDDDAGCGAGAGNGGADVFCASHADCAELATGCVTASCDPADPTADAFGCVIHADSSLCEGGTECAPTQCNANGLCTVERLSLSPCDDADDSTALDVCFNGECVGNNPTDLGGCGGMDEACTKQCDWTVLTDTTVGPEGKVRILGNYDRNGCAADNGNATGVWEIDVKAQALVPVRYGSDYGGVLGFGLRFDGTFVVGQRNDAEPLLGWLPGDTTVRWNTGLSNEATKPMENGAEIGLVLGANWVANDGSQSPPVSGASTGNTSVYGLPKDGTLNGYQVDCSGNVGLVGTVCEHAIAPGAVIVQREIFRDAAGSYAGLLQIGMNADEVVSLQQDANLDGVPEPVTVPTWVDPEFLLPDLDHNQVWVFGHETVGRCSNPELAGPITCSFQRLTNRTIHDAVLHENDVIVITLATCGDGCAAAVLPKLMIRDWVQQSAWREIDLPEGSLGPLGVQLFPRRLILTYRQNTTNLQAFSIALPFDGLTQVK